MSGLKAPGVWFISLLAAFLALGLSSANAQDGNDPSYKVAESVAEFGGSYWDGEVLVINLTTNTPDVLRRAHEAIIRFLGSDYDVSDVVGREVRYSWLELEGWFVKFVRSPPAFEGVNKIDHNHRLNRLSIGIESEDVRAPITGRLIELGIPTEAVVMTVEPPAFPAAVTSKGRPYLFFVGLAVALALAALALLLARRSRVRRVPRDGSDGPNQRSMARGTVDQPEEHQHSPASL